MDACKEGVDFCKRNKLYGFDLDRINEVRGDHYGFIYWIRSNILLFNLEYDERERLIKKGTMVSYEYDDNDNIITKTFSSGCVINYEYDNRNNRISEYNSEGSKWGFEYDDNNRLITKTHNNPTTGITGIIMYVYDASGNCIQEIRGATNVTSYEYNDNNIIISKTYDGQYTIRYEYDANGGLLREYKPNPWDKVVEHTIEYYDNGQLKRYDDLYIPLI